MQPKTDKEDSTGKRSAAGQDPDDSTSATRPFIETTLIEVSYASDGAPSVDPAECEAPLGAEVIWRGAPGESRPFRIVFLSHSPADAEQVPLRSYADPDVIQSKSAKATSSATTRPQTGGASPGSQLPALVQDSKLEGEAQTCRLMMRPDSGEVLFKYTVEANGGVVDALLVLEMLAAIPSGIVQP